MTNGHNKGEAPVTEQVDIKEFNNWRLELSKISLHDQKNYFEQLCNTLSTLLGCELVLVVKFSNSNSSYELFGNTQMPIQKVISKELINSIFHDDDYVIETIGPSHVLLLNKLYKNPISNFYYYYTIATANQTIKVIALSITELKAKFLKRQHYYLSPLITQAIMCGPVSTCNCEQNIGLSELIEYMPIGIIIINKNGYINFANKCAMQILDMGNASINGTHIGRFLALPSIPKRIINALRNNNQNNFVINVITRSNKTIHANVTSLKYGDSSESALIIQSIENKLQLNEQLQQKENELLRFLNSRQLIVVRTDRQSRIIYANKTFQINTGFLEEGIVGKKLNNFIANKDTCHFNTVWDKFLNTEITQFEFLMQAHNGRQFRWLANIHISSEEVMLLGIDISELRKTQEIIQEQEKFLKDIFEHLPSKVMIIAHNYNVMFSNHPNFKPKENKFQSCHELCFNKEEICFDCKLHEVFTHKIKTHLEIEDENNLKVYSVTTLPLVNQEGKVIFAIEFFDDITAQKKVQASIQEAKKAAENASKLKSSFLGNINHEIRTPLNAIMGFSKLLSMKNADNINYNEYLDIIYSSGQRLLDTITDILELSRLQSGDFVLVKEVFNLNKLLVSIGDNYREHPGVRLGNVQINLSMPNNQIWINTDKLRIIQIVNQLIDNAIKFANCDIVNIWLEIKNENISIIVQDNGSGIDIQNAKYIFEYFGKDHLKTHPLSGTGLGLAIAHNNSRVIGGALTYVQIKKGSRFELLLPHEFINIQQNEKLPKFHWNRTNILIVEDDETNLMYLQELLANTGLNIINAKNGKEALEIFNEKIDLILLDIQMPVIDGIKVAKIIRSQGSKVPIIALTAHHYHEKECLSIGCNQFITKPIYSNVLFKVLQQYLAK